MYDFGVCECNCWKSNVLSKEVFLLQRKGYYYLHPGQHLLEREEDEEEEERELLCREGEIPVHGDEEESLLQGEDWRFGMLISDFYNVNGNEHAMCIKPDLFP